MPYDPAKAKKLLAEAGYPNGFDTVLKVAPQYYYTVRSGEVIAENLKKVGVNVKIEQIEWGQWLSRVFCRPPCTEPDYDLTIIGHAESWDIGNYANPKYYFRYDSAEVPGPVQELRGHARRQGAPRALREDAAHAGARTRPVVWLYMHPRLAVAKKGLTGLWKDLPVPAADLSEVGWTPAK